MQDGLGGGDREHEIGLHESRMDASPARDGRQPVVLRVVDDDPPAERPRLWRGEDAFEVALAEPPPEPARHEDRLALVRYPAALELRDRHRDGRLTSVLRRAGQRERRRLDEDRCSSAWCDERVQPTAGERKAECIADGCLHVDDPPGRGGRTKDDVVVARRNEDDTRPRKQRNATHGRYPTRP